MYCLQYKTVIIYLNRTEVCWLVKRTFNITIRPCLRFITQSYFITMIYILLHSISAVSREFLEVVYRFGSPKIESKKSSSTPPRSFFFYQTDKLSSFKFIESRTYYTLTFESSMVWPKKTTEVSHKKEKKRKNSNLNPHALQLLPIEHATVDHSKNLGHCL